MKQYKGSCHCGRITFEAKGDLNQVFDCNCSICQRKAALMWMIPKSQFRLLTPAADMGTYTFNKHQIKHHFCPTCGIHPFGAGIPPSGKEEMIVVNARCLEDIDLSTLDIQHYDGRSL